MFVIKISYKVPLLEVENYLNAHRKFLDFYYNEGLFIASGPMKPRTGGIIIAATRNREFLESALEQDPFRLADIADYELIEFTPVKHCEALKELLLKSES
jgi:uncharacterized protein YciI